MHSIRYPGFLFAKRLDASSEARVYNVLFCHEDLRLHEEKLTRLREDFEWQTGHAAFQPVLAVRPLPGGILLLVRFLDDGKDSFGRNHTLRMEAILVPQDDFAKLWNGAFAAKAIPDDAMFEVTPAAWDGSPGNQVLWFHDQVGSFRLRSAPCEMPSVHVPPPSPVGSENKTKRNSERGETIRSSRSLRKMVGFLLLLWLLTCLVVWFLYDQNRDFHGRLKQAKQAAAQIERTIESRAREIDRRERRLDGLATKVQQIRDAADGILLNLAAETPTGIGFGEDDSAGASEGPAPLEVRTDEDKGQPTLDHSKPTEGEVFSGPNESVEEEPLPPLPR